MVRGEVQRREGRVGVEPRGFPGYSLNNTVKGPPFEETTTHILFNHQLIETYHKPIVVFRREERIGVEP